jgi:hypothetical protein
MRTNSNKIKLTPIDINLDGAAVNLPSEEDKKDEQPKSDEDTPELDEDILMYMINI